MSLPSLNTEWVSVEDPKTGKTKRVPRVPTAANYSEEDREIYGPPGHYVSRKDYDEFIAAYD
jgi:hypothetical protein